MERAALMPQMADSQPTRVEPLLTLVQPPLVALLEPLRVVDQLPLGAPLPTRAPADSLQKRGVAVTTLVAAAASQRRARVAPGPCFSLRSLSSAAGAELLLLNTKRTEHCRGFVKRPRQSTRLRFTGDRQSRTLGCKCWEIGSTCQGHPEERRGSLRRRSLQRRGSQGIHWVPRRASPSAGCRQCDGSIYARRGQRTGDLRKRQR